MNKSVFVSLLTILLLAASALGASVTYTIEMNAFDQTGNLIKQSQLYNQECDTTCTFPNILEAQENNTLINYTLVYPSGNYKLYFSSNYDVVTTQNDSVTLEIYTTPVPQISCTNAQCDAGCARCEDNNCHEPGFKCVSELTLEKITPETIKTGVSQLNILLRNTGTIDLTKIYAEVSGDGVTTLDKISLDRLVVGDKDYAFVKINATKTGKTDLIIKIYIGGQLRSRIISSLNILADETPTAPVKEEGYNVTELTKSLNTLKNKYNSLSNQYQQKKMDGYIVDLVYEEIKSSNQFLTSAQAALFSGDYKIAKTNIEVAQESLADIELQLNSSVKQQKSLADTIRSNILYVGAIAAALVSLFSLVAHFRKVVNKEKIERLKDKVKLTKKDEALAKTDKALAKKDKELERKDKELEKEINSVKKVVKKTIKPAKAKQAEAKKE